MTSSKPVSAQQVIQGKLQSEEGLQLARLLIEQSADAIFWVDSNAQFLFVNRAACRLTGYSQEQLLSGSLGKIEPGVSPNVWSKYWNTVRQQGALVLESQYRTKQGRILPVEITLTFVECQGQEVGCVLARDVTKHKHMEAALRKANTVLKGRFAEHTAELIGLNNQLCHEVAERQRTETVLEKFLEVLQQSEAKFRTLAEITDVVILIKQGTQLRYINPATELITGYTREELLAHSNACQLLQAEGFTNLHIQDGTSFPQYQEIKLLTKRGEERWFDCSYGVLMFEGNLAELITAIDITRRKQAEEEIHQALEQLRELSELRARLVSMISHEFRTPLNLISFSTSLLKRNNQKLSEEKKFQYLDCILGAVEQLSQLLDKVLIIGKAEAGRLKFEPRTLDLAEFCSDLLAEIRLSEGDRHNLRFINQSICSIAYVDENLLQPILSNLLSNAIKYSAPESTITLTLCCQDASVILQINDEGIGILIADQSQLFEPFHRGENVGDLPGTGLGLTVVKKLVDEHNGQITFDSKVGVGTTFTIKLPLQSLEVNECIPVIHPGG